MHEDLDYQDPFGAWHSSELLDSSPCLKCLELHGVHAPCTPPKPLPADAVSLLPRSIKSGITGALSLHDYRKYLSQSAECVDDPVDRSEKTLKRKTATSNLNRPPPLTSFSSCAISVSSVASSTPPLSPSYSHSIISYQSEQEPEVSEASTGTLQAIPNVFRSLMKIKQALTTLQLSFHHPRAHECILSRRTLHALDRTGSDW
jgi:hypothetical protein